MNRSPVSEAGELKPCPFCGECLERSEQFSNRSADTFMHPDNGCVLALNLRIIVPLQGYRTDRDGELERIAAWNRRSLTPPAVTAGETEPAVKTWGEWERAQQEKDGKR